MTGLKEEKKVKEEEEKEEKEEEKKEEKENCCGTGRDRRTSKALQEVPPDLKTFGGSVPKFASASLLL